MSNTLGAPFGGTTRGAHHAFDSEALSLITPPNSGGGGGSSLPLLSSWLRASRGTRDLLSRRGDATEGENTCCGRKGAATDFHIPTSRSPFGGLRLSPLTDTCLI